MKSPSGDKSEVFVMTGISFGCLELATELLQRQKENFNTPKKKQPVQGPRSKPLRTSKPTLPPSAR